MSARAERTFLEVSVININTALSHQAALLYLTGQTGQLVEMDGMNPFELVQTALDVSVVAKKNETVDIYPGLQYRILPAGYQGEVDETNPDTIEAGHWYFDRSQETLVYRVRNDEYFYSDSPGLAVIRFRVRLTYEDLNANQRYDPETDLYSGISLENLGGYQWQI